MSKLLVIVGLMTALSHPAKGTEPVQALLARADHYRLAGGAMQVLTEVTTFKGGKPDKERRYLVYVRPGRQSLVLSKSAVESGQKVLMLGDDFWIILPTSQRPVRITPAQKLLGDASTGDIATMTWAGDYDGEVAGEAEVNGTPCVRLDLVAQRRGVSYRRVELYLTKADARPLRADLYVASEKLAKRATFEVGMVGGSASVTSMTLADEIQPGRKTVVRYLSRVPRAVGDEYYNPMFLTHNEPRD